jgi:translation initiation factor IF-2
MSKIRVHELAKELGLQSNDIMNFLNTNGREVKSAQSGLEDADVAAVKKHFQKTEAPKAAPKSDDKKAEAPKKEGEAKPKKKSTITAVFNAQYSKDGHGNKKNNGNRNNDNRKRDGQRDDRRKKTASTNSVRPAGGLIKPRAGVDHIRRQDHAVEEP